jgi:hypothetical protein
MGSNNFHRLVRENSKDAYYDYEGDNADDADDGEDASGDPTPQVPRQPTVRYDTRSANKAQAINPADQRTLGDMLDVVLALWRRPAREGERRPPGSDAADVTNNENKIQTWLQSMEESTS